MAAAAAARASLLNPSRAESAAVRKADFVEPEEFKELTPRRHGRA